MPHKRPSSENNGSGYAILALHCEGKTKELYRKTVIELFPDEINKKYKLQQFL